MDVRAAQALLQIWLDQLIEGQARRPLSVAGIATAVAVRGNREADMARDNRKLLHIEVGPLQIDVPQTVGYYGGIGAALAFGLLEPPLAAFIAAVPLIKILAERGSPIPVRFLAEVLEGAARPVGSDADGTVRLADPDRAQRDIQKVKAAAEPAAAKRHAASV
ncbi:MAG: hypothetical protein JWQ37_2264 [Blastococcus sp.]|nr:hypothetical protein [Blastococcus sp.]